MYYSCNNNSDNVNDSKNSLKQVKNTSDQLDVIIRVGPWVRPVTKAGFATGCHTDVTYRIKFAEKNTRNNSIILNLSFNFNNEIFTTVVGEEVR